MAATLASPRPAWDAALPWQGEWVDQGACTPKPLVSQLPLPGPRGGQDLGLPGGDGL